MDHDVICGLTLLGPLTVCVILLVKGRAWLSWLAETESCAPAESALLRQGCGGQARRAKIAGLVLIALAALATIPGLGSTTFFDRDEGYYAECAREMAAGGNLFVPTFSGKPWMEKPPLTYWAMAACMKLLGGNEFAARLPSALAGLLAIWLTFRLAARMYSPKVGVIAGAMLGTSALFGVVTRLALLDTTLLCCVLLSMNGLWEFVASGSRAGLWLFYLGCGAGMLAKGPLGIALPIIALIGFVALERRWRMLLEMRALTGALIVCVVVGLWVIPANWLTGGSYVYELVWESTIQPIFTPLQGHGGADLGEYLATLPVYVPGLIVGFLPWCAFLLPAARCRACAVHRKDRRTRFLAGWALAQLLVFSLIRTKLPHHILPILPPVAILCGVFLSELISGENELSGAWDHVTSGIPLFLLLLAGVAILFLPAAAQFEGQAVWFLPAGLVLISVALWAMSALPQQRYDRVFIAFTAGMVLCLGLFWQVGLPRFEQGKSARRLADFLKNRYGAAGLERLRLGRLGYREVSVVFYLGRPVQEIDGNRSLKPFLQDPSPAAAIVPEKDLRKAIASGLDVPYRTIWDENVWIPEKSEWQEVVILTNEAAGGFR
ncbi:MAG: glycosyltransferase family 39 protein [Candidatus Brocadiia bacterium]